MAIAYIYRELQVPSLVNTPSEKNTGRKEKEQGHLDQAGTLLCCPVPYSMPCAYSSAGHSVVAQ